MFLVFMCNIITRLQYIVTINRNWRRLRKQCLSKGGIATSFVYAEDERRLYDQNLEYY